MLQTVGGFSKVLELGNRQERWEDFPYKVLENQTVAGKPTLSSV